MLASDVPGSTKSSASSQLLPPASAASSAIADCNQIYGNEAQYKSMCQAAYDFPSNFLHCADRHTDAISTLATGILYKNFSTCNNPEAMKSRIDCVQCVEAFPDSINHCVPDWDATCGKEMDILWEQTDLFSPSKGKWDTGHTKKSDLGFVPELDFEELCWEDGQLFVVMQGLNGRGTRNRSAYHTDDTTLTEVSPTNGTFDPPHPTELVDPSSVNVQTQEDELFSWLQHPPEDIVDRLETLGDLPVGTSSAPVSKSTKPDISSCAGNKIDHGSIHQQKDLPAKPILVSTVIAQKGLSCEPFLALPATEVGNLSPSLAHSGFVSTQDDLAVPNAGTNNMNFSNFSRPAVAIKANLQSLGIVNGLRGPERLKQLGKMTNNMRKSELNDCTAKHLRVIAPRKESAAVFCQGVGASPIQSAKLNTSLHKEARQITSATRHLAINEQDSSIQSKAGLESPALNNPLQKRIQSDTWNSSWNSSMTSSTNVGEDATTEVLEVPEASELSSSGASEESNDADGKRVLNKVKRKACYDGDSEFQSEKNFLQALNNEATGNKKQVTAGGNEIKKSRAAENHNQSERRRRDRISEKMKTLQELLPSSYKSDKASMLEEAIAYIKALKSQIQMMSQRSSTCFSPFVKSDGAQHVQMAAWPYMNKGFGMHMGMGMNVGMGLHDMNVAMATTALRPFQFPMMMFPTTLVPAMQSNATPELNKANSRPGVEVATHVSPFPHHQSSAPVQPGNLRSCMKNSTHVGNGARPPSHSSSQQGLSVQDCPPSLTNGVG